MRRIEVAGLVGVVLLAVPVLAEAKVFKAGPMRYMTSTTTVAPGSHTGFTGYCEQGTRVSAGGFGVNGPLADAVPTSSHPVDGGDVDSDHDDGWYANIFNNGDKTLKMKHARICLRPGIAAGQMTYGQSSHAVGAGTVSSAYFEPCFGSRVLGGGAQIVGNPVNNRLEATGPWSSQGSQHVPDDGWSVRTTTSNGPGQNVIFNICMPSGAVAFRYRRKQAVIHGGQTKRLVVRCPNKPGWRVAGGGVQGLFLRVKQSFPWDSNDKRKAPDDGWVVRAGLVSVVGDPVVAIAHAICIKKK